MSIVVAIDGEPDGEEDRATLRAPCEIIPVGFEIADKDTGESDGIGLLFEPGFELSVILIDERKFRHTLGNALHENRKKFFHNVLCV